VRSAALLVALVVAIIAACGGKVEPILREGGDPRAGFVKCGGESCDVGSGNQCYSCTNGVDWSCHSQDLPGECEWSRQVRRECDGQEDCKNGMICTLDAYGTTVCR
jgi:hypothetical protein